MKKILAILILLFIHVPVEAQNLSRSQLDSLYNLFVSERMPNHHTGIQSIDTTHIKCGLRTVLSVKNNLNNFRPEQKPILQKLLQRPVTDTSFVTPNGFFRVHYNISGSDLPKYSLDSLAIALDSAYNFEVNYLGYPPPPSDNGAGGDDKYDIYVINLADVYGQTVPDSPIGSGQFTSFMDINTNYNGFYTSGINAARVTVAHEFHHSIQIGNYILRYDLDEFFYELTSTSMEHFVYPSIHDYYQYLHYYFTNTQSSFGTNGGLMEYALAIWNIYLQENFGYDIIKKEWQLMPQMRALQAISKSMVDYQTSFGQQLNKFGIWTYFTNYRTVPGDYFKKAEDYPIVQPVTTLNFNQPSKTVQLSTGPVSNSFITFVNQQNLDTLVTLITNADIAKGIDSTSALETFQYSLFDSAQSGANKLTDNYYESFNVDKPVFWLTAAILNNKVIESENFVASSVDFPYPNPYEYKKIYYYGQFISFPVKPDTLGYDLYIYSVSMRLVYSSHLYLTGNNGRKVIEWNGLDNHNNQLSTGVYFYIIKSGDNISKGKLVIFNE